MHMEREKKNTNAIPKFVVCVFQVIHSFFQWMSLRKREKEREREQKEEGKRDVCQMKCHNLKAWNSITSKMEFDYMQASYRKSVMYKIE